MLNKKLMILTIVLVSLLAVSAVSAQDNATSDVVSVEETTDEVVSADENQVILSENNDVGTFDDLQIEIDNATEGSVLNLTRDYNGDYGSRIQLNKNLTIDGQGHTLDCLGKDGCSAFDSNSGTITLKNLIIINGHNDFNNKGGAIYIEGSAQYTIINCTFSNNWADDYGGAIYNGVDKPLTIINSSFDKNTADDDNGGAIYSKGDLDIINSTFTSNNADDDGGAIYCEKSVSVENCLFEKNKAKVDGGAIYSKNNVNVTKNTRFYSNNATGATSAQCYGGAIRSEGNVEVDHATFNNNVAGDYGGAIYANNASISSAKFESNKADDNYGGAVYVEDSVDAISTTFSSNHAGDHGGAIYSKNRIFAKNTRFTSNYARHKGSSVRCEGDVIIEDCYSAYNWAYQQGSIAAAGDIYIKNSEFRKDRVTNFGAAVYGEKNIYVDNGYFSECHAQEKGGAVYCKNNVIAVNSRFDGNDVFYSWEEDSWKNEGGAIYSKGDVAIDNCYFIRNEAREAGGAIYADTITWGNSSSEFRDNHATYTAGGAIYVNKFNTDVKYGIFINNDIGGYKTEKDGGAIYINKENHVTFSHCYFENNRATDEGGAIYLDSTKSHLTLEYNIFINNNANDKGNIVYNKGTYDKIHNNWYGSNSFDFSNELVEYNAWGSDKSHEDDEQVIVELSLDENPIAGQPSTLVVRFISDGELFNYGAGFRADNGAKLTNKKTGNNTVTSDIAFDDGITTVTATVNRQVLKLSYSYSKQNVTMDITAQEIIFGDNATVNVILTPDNATGKVSVGNIFSTIVNGTATLIIPDLAAGNQTLLVSYSGDGVYKAKQENVTITVHRKNLNIDASAKPIVKGDNATVIVTGLERATGNVTVTINNTDWTGEIRNGTATIIIPGLNENTTANVTYLGDANYINASTTVDIIVNPVKMNLTIIASADPIMVTEDAIVVVTGLENATGNVTVTIGGAEWYGEINDGTATVIIIGLKLNATADVFYAGDYLYNNATTKVNITVTPTIFVWYVNGSKESSGNGTTPDTAFKTLKEALKKAPENSTIYIAPGTYTGENNINLTINKNNLTLANYGAGEVIFDAQSSSRILTVNAGRINITGLTFKNGKEEYVCGAIFFSQTLNNSYINAIFINNSVVDGLGGAIGFYADVINTDINSIFINNSVNNGYGGAIFFNGNLNNVIISGNYTANTAGDYGGAILFNGDLNNVIISGNYTANTANDGGAIFFNGNLADVNISGYYNNNQANDTAGVFLFINNLTNVVISGDYINNVARFCAVCYMSEFATVNDSSISGDYYNNSAGYCVVLLMEGIISNSNISGNYANNHAIMGINILGEAYNVNMCGNYVNNNISNGSAIYIGYCDENSVIHDSIFINNTIDDELIIDVESGSLLSVNNWFGNNASNYNIKPKVSENVTMANWLFLNATTNTTSEITENETAEITFKLYAYNSTSEEIKEYDASEMNIRLDLSPRSGTLNQTTAFLDEAILYQCGEEGIASVTGKFETASYAIILAKQSTEIIINKTEMTLKVNDSVSAGATLNPPEAGNLTYTSSDATVAVVENGIIKGLNEGAAIITVSFAGNDEYAPAVSKNITVYVEKRIPLIITGADVTDNGVTIHVDIDGYDGFISMDLFDSLVYLPISSSVNFTQSLAPGVYDVNITALGNYMFYSGSEILTFAVPEPEKLNTSISAQSSVNVNTVTITVDVDSNASGFVEIDIAGREYYVPVVNGTAVFINDYSSGSYVADVTYLGDEIYSTNTTKTEFSIVGPVKENTTIGLDVDIVENNITFTVNVDKDATGLVKFEFNDKVGTVIYADVKDGQAMILGLLEAGNYTVVATYVGDDRFNTNITYKDFTVIGHIKKDTPIAAEVDVSGYKVTISVDVDSGATGFVRLQIGDTIANVELENGIGTYTTTLPAGSYNVDLTYLGDENYNKNRTKASFNIADPVKENTTISLDVETVENAAIFTVNVDKNATGLVKFEVNDEIGTVLYADVKDGQVVLSGLLEAGNYTVVATYMGDDVFNTNTISKEFEIVGHVMKDTPITAKADVNGYKVTITVDVDSNATGFVEVKYDDTIINIALANGTGTYTTTLPAGSYNVDLTYLGDDNYNKNSTKLSFSIADPVKENTSISLDVQTIENNVTFIVNVDKDATGLVKFEVSSDEASVIYVDVKDGQAVLDVLLDAGNHTVVATYLGDDRFNTNITYKEFTVIGHVKKDTPITAQADVNGYKVTVTVDVDSGATGFVRLQIGDTIANVELENGIGTYTTTLPAGSYYVQVTYLGDEDYNTNSTKTAFTITEAAKQNTAIGLEITIKENMVLFNASVDKSASGLIKFQLFYKELAENQTVYMDMKNGEAIVVMGFEKGNYTIIATYLGDKVFNTNTTSKDFEIVGHVMKDTPITAQADVNGYKVTITVDVDSNATGFVEVKYDDTIINIALTNGTGTYTTTLPAGSYNVDLTYLGDENYNKNSTKLSFNIADPVKENTPISLDVETFENTAVFTVNVDKDATGLVKFEVNDEIGTVLYADVKDGKAALSGLLEAGNYTVVATYMGDDRFNTNITYKEFTVIGHVKKDTPITVDSDVNGYKVTISVNVDSGATGFVKLQIGDTIANVELENGIGTYTTTLPAGSYYVQATYLGDEDYNTNSTQTAFTITEAAKQNTPIGLEIAIDENKVLVNASVDKSASGLVKFQVFNKQSGENQSVYVDVENGEAIAPLIFEKGNYTLIATYLGDNVFNTNTTSKDFEIMGHVMKDTPITAQADVNGYKVTITVGVDSNATGFVEVKYDDTIINIALTNGTGTYTTTLPAGSYNVDLTYLGDENYNKNSTKLSFSIADPVKENTPISLDVESVENTAVFTVNVDKDATGLVKFEVNDENGTVLYADVKDGEVVLSGLLEAGNYTVVATYMGDDRFNTNITYKEFTVIGHVKKDTPITVDSDVNGYKVTISVAVDVDATGFVRLQIGDTIANVELENGIGTYTTTLPAGSYYVQATYLGDEDYNTNSTQTAFTITEAAKQNTPIGLEIAIDENKVLVNVSVDESASGLVKFQVFNKQSGENQSVYVDVENGEAIAPLVFEKGNYTLIATYMGDAVFNTNATSKDFEIIGHVMKDTSITAQADVNGYKVTVTVDVDDDATGFVKLQIGDTIVNIELKNGTGTYITTLPAGSYNVDVTYLGDENYNSNDTKLSFNILDSVKENTPISLDVETVENTAIFTVNVDKDATGLVKFEVNDEMGTVLYADVKDGQAMLSGLLAAGNYTVVATYLGDARFNTNITYKDFTVIGHLMKDTPITAQADVSGYKVTVTVAVDVDATGFVRLQIGDAIVNVELENGIGTYTTTLLAGSYYVQATYLGDEDYNTNSTQTAFTVTDPVKENTTIGLNVLINENEVIFNVTVNELATGLVKLQIFNKESGKNETVYVDVENGVAESDYVIGNGNYTVIATYLGDDVFNSNTTSKDFEVIGHVMKDTPITAKADVNGYKVTITADVDSNATGFVEIKYADTQVYIALENGTGTYVTTLPAGSYHVDVTYIGDENYNANATNLAFNVVNPVKENTTISIDVSSVENNVVFTVDVNLNASGIVRFEVYGAEVYIVYADVLDGVAMMEDVLEAGDYTVVATYMGDDRFNSNSTSESFSIKGHVKKDTPIIADAKVNGNKVTVTVNVDENATGFVGLTQSGSTIYIALENGVATYTDVLPAGSYNVEVTYAGDDDFNENSTRVLFTVVEASKENTTIAADVSVVDSNVTFTVFVNENATGIVKFDVAGANGSTVLYVDVVSGKAVLECVSKSGNYTLVATYMGDERFNSNVTSVDFTVSVPEKQDTNVSICIPSNIKPGDNATVEVSIPNATGNVSVIVDGKETVVPLVNGSASVLLDNISAGNHSVVVIYSGDETHAPAHSASAFNVPVVVKDATEFAEIVVSADKITAVLKDSQGKAVSGAVISYAIGDVSNTTMTDENGTFTIDIVSKSVVLISYAGNDSLLGTNTSIVVDSVVETKLACEFNVTEGVSIKTYAVDLKAGEIGCVEYFKLTDSNGNPIANATIKFAYKAVILNRTTDENGIVYLGINTYVAQTALCAMSYLGNEKYNATFVAFSFDIQLKPISITAKAKTFKKSTKTKKYTVTLKTQKCNSRDGKVYLSSGKKVTLKVNGKTYTAKTNSKGQATFKITKLAKKGKYTAVIKFAGDKTYKSASKKVKITVK